MNLAHVILLVHLECATIDNFLDGGLVCARVVPILVNVVINLVRKLVALFEALMVCTHKNYPQIHLSEAYVDVKHVLLGAPGYANRCPCLTIRHRTECHHEVENDGHIYRNK